jgi:ankyrin repeat protein
MEVVRILLEKGVDVDREVFKEALLYTAFACRHTEIAKLLLESGANINKAYRVNPSNS